MVKQLKAFILSAFVMLGISACASTGGGTSAESDYFQMTEFTAFEGGVIGKKLLYKPNESNHITIDADGTWKGTWNGSPIFGEWEWDDAAFCRTINTGEPDCQTVEMSSTYDSLRFTRDRGKGPSWIMLFGQN